MQTGTKRILKAFSMSMILLLTLTAPIAGGTQALAVSADKKAPTAPARLSAFSVGQTALKLAWSASRDNTGVASYTVYKNGVVAMSSTTSYCTVRGLKANTTYKFYIKAKDRSGNVSGRSNTVTVKTAGAGNTSASASAKIVAGYYASWSAYAGYTPADIPASYLTHIIYAFANIDSSYKITLGDAQVDPGNFAELKSLKTKHPKLKTLISVGGWTWSGKFSDMAATSSRRAAFADSVAAFLKKYGLDGVDLDWEYPVGGGMAGNSTSPADKTNFTLLLQALRSRLDTQGRADGKRYLLTIAGGAGTDYIGHVQLPAIAKYLDFATVMTYDMHGAYDAYTDLNAPLYPTSDSPQEVWSADQAVKAWTAAGFPKGKLVMGVPFYGHLYSSVLGGGTGLYDTYSAMKTVSYDQITASYLTDKSYKRYYADAGKTPWLFNGSNFITYEDTKSIAAKSAYIKSSGIAGAGVWDLGENKGGTLIKALYSGLK